jgi:hypothetical protein
MPASIDAQRSERAMRARDLFSLLILTVTLTGCGSAPPPLVAVEGIVLLDGNPLAGVLVEFIPEDEDGRRLPFSTGETGVDGRFQLRCETNQPGAVIGPHKVIIRRPSVRPAPDAPPPPPQGVPVPLQYQSILDTPLSVDVQPEQLNYVLTLRGD